MLCREVDERIEAWLDGELPAEEARLLAAHLDGCAACAAAAEWARTVRDGLRGLPSHDAPPAAIERIKAAARERPRRGDVVPGPWSSRSRPGLGAFLALAAALVIALGLAFRLGPAAPAGTGDVRAEAPEHLGPAATAEIERAESEVRLALALVGRYSRRAGDDVQRELADVATSSPTLRGLGRALAPLGAVRAEAERDGGPPSA